MSDDIIQEQGAVGTEESTGVADPSPAVEPELTNAELKKHPWVEKLKQESAELRQLKSQMAEEAARAEQAAAEARGEYDKALEMEKAARKEAETTYQQQLTALKLETEFTKAGLLDSRAVQLFEGGFDPETMSAADYVASVKADSVNSLYFGDPNRRTKQTPPTPAGGHPDDFDPERDLDSWLRSSDDKKRARAIEHNRKAYERKLGKR